MKHRGTYDELAEKALIRSNAAFRTQERERGGRPPRLHMCANAPKHAELWTKAIEDTLPKHRRNMRHPRRGVRIAEGVTR